MKHPLLARRDETSTTLLEADRALRAAQNEEWQPLIDAWTKGGSIGQMPAEPTGGLCSAARVVLDAARGPAQDATSKWQSYLARADGTNEAQLAAELGYSLDDLADAEQQIADMLANA